MSLLKQRDLKLLVKTGAKIGPVTLSPVLHKDKIFYEVHLDIESKDGIDPCLIITYKNEPQKWSSINKAIDTLSSLMPDLESVLVRVDRSGDQ